MGTGYTRQSDPEIEDGLVIEASSLDNEFDALQASFNGTSGHSHDGSIGEGPKINLTTSISGVLPIANGGTGGINKLNATTSPTVNEDSNDGYSVGSVWIDTTNDVYYVCIDSTVGAAVWRRFQPYDVDLAAIAALTSAADKVPYSTGAGTWALNDFTAFGRSLVDDADAATARTTLGLVIGTNVQAYDAELAAIAGLTSAADRVPYYTGSGTASLATFTAAGRALVDDADASSQLTTLGVSTFMKTVLDDVDAATARTTLGVDTSSFQPVDPTLTALAAFNTNGILTQTAADTFTGRTLTGTAAEITVTNGNGVSGNPTISLPAALTFTGKTITGGTYTGMTDIAVADGGTGVSTITGLIKGNGTSPFTAATAGTDYYSPGTTDIAVADGGTNISSYTAGDLLYASGTTTLSKLAKGTAFQLLRMNSGATAPEWAAAPVTPIRRTYTASTTWTKPANLVSLEITVHGASGGGGGTTIASSSKGGSGGGGSIAKRTVLAASLGATETVTIGAKGTGGAAGGNDGTAGGTTSFGTLVVVTGGAQGSGANGSSANNGAGGTVTSSGSDRIWLGADGDNSSSTTYTSAGAWNAKGTLYPQTDAAGNNAVAGTGNGGTGARRQSSGGPFTGGDGDAGFIEVVEYY